MRTDNRIGMVRVEISHVNKGTRRILKETAGVFRDAVSYLIHVACDHFDELDGIDSEQQLTVMERLVHHTKEHPCPEYDTFDVLFYKLPCYIRRAAIHGAVGHVMSHQTRCDQYSEQREFEVSRGHHYKKMEPRFTYTPNAWPTLYKMQSYKMDTNVPEERIGTPDEYRDVSLFIKARMRNTWDWLAVSIPSRDMKCLKKAQAHGRLFNPKLVFAYNKFYLEFPVQYICKQMPEVPLAYQKILSADLGLNNGAVCSVMDASGTILAREFDPFKADTDRILHVINLIRKKASQSGRGQSLSSLYTKLDGLKDNFAKQLARWIVNLAVKYGVYGIVLEHLGGMKGHGKGRLRTRVHHWTVAKIRDYVRGMAFREGIRTFLINPKGTSMYAYDGSGKVERDKENYSMCTFSTGKRYNCDLSASYNIGARYFIRSYKKAMPATAWSELTAKVPELSKRTQWTLHALRELHPYVEPGKASAAA